MNELPTVLTWEGQPVTEETLPLAKNALKEQVESCARMERLGERIIELAKAEPLVGRGDCRRVAKGSEVKR